MIDLSAFSEEKFDAKKWINTACLNRHPQETLEKQLVDLEMKLQMMSEEIAASLEEQSTAALLRVPRATRDVIRVRDDAVSLRHSVSSILLKLKKVASSSSYFPPRFLFDCRESGFHLFLMLVKEGLD